MDTRDPISPLPDEARRIARKRAQPTWFEPVLATLVAEAFSGDDWIFEPKFDGVRCLVFRDSKGVELLSRNHKGLNDTYPELVESLAAQAPVSYILDGEVVAFKDGVTSFSQ